MARRIARLTSGATSLARGMNDAPKMVALLLAASALSGKATVSTPGLFAIVTTAMVVGGILAGRRVTHVLAEKVTAMDQVRDKIISESKLDDTVTETAKTAKLHDFFSAMEMDHAEGKKPAPSTAPPTPQPYSARIPPPVDGP